MTVSSVAPADRSDTVRHIASGIATSGGRVLDVRATADDKFKVGLSDGFL